MEELLLGVHNPSGNMDCLPQVTDPAAVKAADLGYKIDDMERKLFLQLVADDGMSWINSIEELQAVIHLFEFYADRYKMSFSFPKTLINVYGSKEQINSVRNSEGIKIAGNDY